MKKITILIAVLLPIVVMAGDPPGLKNSSYVNKSNIPLFDPSKLTMRQSYSFSYLNGGGYSGSIGCYINSLEYEFSNPLSIRVDLGYLHSPTRMFSQNSSGLNSGMFVPGVSLNWRPSEHFNLRLDYRQAPYGDHDNINYFNSNFLEERH